MKPTIQKYIEYMRSVRNSSPHTLVNYGNDLEQFVAFLTPPGAETPKLGQITHHMIREFVAHLHEAGLEKSSIARKLAALFFQVLRAGRPAERKSGAAGGNAEAAETSSRGVVGGRDERVFEPACGKREESRSRS